MEALIAFYLEQVAENSATVVRRRAEEARDEKEKSDIAATKQTIVSWWEKHRPGEALPPEIADSQIPVPISATSQSPCVDPSDRAKQSLAVAFEQMPVRFTTKDFFPLVPEIQSEEVPDSQGYDFLRRQVDEGKLWVFQQGAGRRPTTYSKEPVDIVTRLVNTALADRREESTPVKIGFPMMTAAEGFGPALARLSEMHTKPETSA